MPDQATYVADLNTFNHDKKRGKWSSPLDFFFTSLGHAFKFDAVFLIPTILFRNFGIFVIAGYFAISAVCVVPIIFIQSYLGQFSRTGFISVFRIAPLFKGMGYVSLAINLVTLTYFSVFGAIPLFYLYHSLGPTLPWSCENAQNWMDGKGYRISPCLQNVTVGKYDQMDVPSLEFFKLHFPIHTYVFLEEPPNETYSSLLVICTLLIWTVVAVVLSKPIEVIARFVRYSCLAVIGILYLCVIRCAFLPNAFTEPNKKYKTQDVVFPFLIMPLLAFSALGPGWGSILTMASYNNFKTNIFKYSWLLGLGQFGVVAGLAMLPTFVSNFLQNMVLTSLFDEYEKLRDHKRRVTLVAVAFLALTSIYFCSNKKFAYSESLTNFSIITQMILNLLLLLVVLWVYGRERFQKDVKFMTSRTLSTWMINTARCATPIFLLIGLLWGGILSLQSLLIYTILIPWLLVPGYCIFKVIQTNGTFRTRFKQCVAPSDWYPVDPVDRQRYEETLSSVEIPQELTTTAVG